MSGRTITATFYVDEDTRTGELLERVKTLAHARRSHFGAVSFRPPIRRHDGLVIQADIDVIGSAA